jgi:hypothetical protein
LQIENGKLTIEKWRGAGKGLPVPVLLNRQKL